MELIKKWLPTVAILLGVYLFSHNVFDFASDRGCARQQGPRFGEECSNPVAYYYEEESAHGIGIGAVLIVAGSMVYLRRNKR